MICVLVPKTRQGMRVPGWESPWRIARTGKRFIGPDSREGQIAARPRKPRPFFDQSINRVFDQWKKRLAI
jgi:hypothetical protein